MCTAKVYNSFQACLTSFYLHLILQIEDSTFFLLGLKHFFMKTSPAQTAHAPPTSSPFLENIPLHLFSFLFKDLLLVHVFSSNSVWPWLITRVTDCVWCSHLVRLVGFVISWLGGQHLVGK